MAGHGTKLERRQEVAIAALLSEPTVEAAAKKAKVGYATLKGWLQLSDFQAAYRAARAAVLERTVTRLLRTCDRAVDRLERNLDSGNVPGSNRAAEVILAKAVKGVEALDLRAEIEELKRQFAAMKKGVTEDGDGGDHGDGATGDAAAEDATEEDAATTDPNGEPDPEPQPDPGA